MRAGAQDPIHWRLGVLSKGPVLAGRTFDAGLTATIDRGWHLYALVEPDSGPIATVITLPVSGTFQAAGDAAAPAGTVALDPNFNVETEFFEDRVTFLLPLKVAALTKPGRYKLEVTASWQTCNDRLCLPPTDAVIALDVDVGVTGASPPVSTTIVKGSAAPDSASAPAVRAPVLDMAADSRASSLGQFLGVAALMGLLSLVTPCVFPMVPITVSYFTSRARKRRRDAITQALTYGLGIVLTFTALGFVIAVVFGASGLNQFAANPWLNLGVTAMFVLFALSLFGISEVRLPSRLLTAVSSADEGRGPLSGTLLMGLAFTLTSFTCTAPFLGTLLVVASQGDWQWPLLGMLAFSTVFALPFVVLAFVPQWMASLPRSGPWLVSVKAVMGIVELAAAMKFLSNVDLVWGWHVFTRTVVLCTWLVLAVVLAAYLAGIVPLGPAPSLGRPRVTRGIGAVGAMALGVWLAMGLRGTRLGELEAFLPPAEVSAIAANGELPWIVNDYAAALARGGAGDVGGAAHAGAQRILIDFTGYTCTNCRWMEANMFTRPDVARELARYVRVRLYTDGRGEPFRSFQRMEQQVYGTVALPYYAVITPDGKPVVGFGGLTRDPALYLAFLRRGME